MGPIDTNNKRSAAKVDESMPDSTQDRAAITAKKARVDSETLNAKACFQPGLFDDADAFTEEFAKSQPFHHCCIAPFCDEQLLQGVRKEMTERLHFTQKETDIFKYHQSGDLANLDGLPEEEKQQLPSLQKLRDAIYSQEFRDFISAVTGCGPLSGSRTDMSTNRYKQGDHLLLHDDVIGDRRVSYIIYLPDPDINDGQGWAPQDGGHLELYPRESTESWAPAVNPTRRLAPQWNQIVFFTVLPGESHHSVEEVAGLGKERLSIQGWFHFPQPGEPGYAPDQMTRLWSTGAVSTLSQIEAKRQRETGSVGDPFTEYPEADDIDDDSEAQLSAEDTAVLAKYLNPNYLRPEVMTQVAEKFADDSHIQLGEFLNKETATVLGEALKAVDEHDGMAGAEMPPHGTGERGRWHAFGSPVIRRFMRLDGPAMANPAEGTVDVDSRAIKGGEATATDTLTAIRDELFASGAYARWLSSITTLSLSGHRGMVRRFRSGLDYTLGTPDGSETTTLDAVLCFVDEPSEWADGVVGGYACYVDGGSDGDEASNDGSVYRLTEDESILLTTPAAWNTLSVVMREPGVVKFVKYVSASAPGSRWDVSFEYQVQADDDEEDDNE
ncbi:Oxoglutarate and iron-dependent oxygenase degradation C-term-domain-containing protein [Kickxella alabastrina]|uniref:Oxoglutarate and iron-dependent oxygenase degradation C-term-domain-containing protein n=1 Tax=Kickxella alabastrina TaxID=61397 RepID=UPI00221E8280|nr:Oxoglutarate and iron-dependent oxygenase degradation C-term-domain-containing protein [Kickxella alabastrina]KAI7825872.1 Oxoglutarate and iron-dependent oxygenase degradation C-term-domain-containing protein [Kickxella alabastrina]KAJ1947276.1 putative component of NuA3 histone acetyltransferase complex [Kickxella alabastrina]